MTTTELKKRAMNAAIEWAEAVEAGDDAQAEMLWDVASLYADKLYATDKDVRVAVAKAQSDAASATDTITIEDVRAVRNSGFQQHRTSVIVAQQALSAAARDRHIAIIGAAIDEAANMAIAEETMVINVVTGMILAGISGNPAAFAPAAGSIASFAKLKLGGE